MGAVVGIDLGTTNTVVAAIRDGRPAALPDESGSTLIPSIVSFLPSGAVLVGSAAKERRSQDARNTIYSVKRLIGRTWDSSEVKEATTRFPFELREGPGRATFVIARGETYTLPEISAFVLRKAKSIAELELGEPVDRAVITVPANFNDLQRAATKVAGRVAGLEVLRILNEPTAAALAFGHTRGNRERIAIYDFGGGTFDLTLLLLTDNVFEVLATAGDTFLGGDDIDNAIVERMARRLAPALGSEQLAQPETLERLRAAAEQLKLELSETPDASVFLEDNEVGGSSGLDFAMSRDDLERLVEPIVTRTFRVCHDALSIAKLGPRDIDHVLLVGGTTRIPLVKRKVEEYFGKRARADLDPHEVVALGAAQQAMALTELRATASGIPVAPPPRRALGSASNESERENEGQGKSPDEPTRQKTDPFGRLRKQTDPGVGDGEESVKPGRVSVVPPEGPLSHPAPTTQNFGSRDRRTTGVGIGPHDMNLPLVGIQPVTPMREALEPTTPPSTLSGLGGSETAASLSTGDEAASWSDLEDLPLPLVPATAQPTKAGDRGAAAARREFTRGPTVRVTRGTSPQPDLSATLNSAGTSSARRSADESSPSTDPLFGAVVRPAASAKAELSPSTDPLFGGTAKGTAVKSPRETIPDEVEPWDEPTDNAAALGLPIVTTTTRLTPEHRGGTAVSRDASETIPKGRKAAPAAADPPADLPLVVSHPMSPKGQTSTNTAAAPIAGQHPRISTDARQAFTKIEDYAPSRLGLPDPGSIDDEEDDTGEDEPTVIRRSMQSASALSDGDPTISAEYADDLPERVSHDRYDDATGGFAEPAFLPAPTSAAPSSRRRPGKPTSLTEDEIRARYGNLPLIVGGKRVGTRTIEPPREPESPASSHRPLEPSSEADFTRRAQPSVPAAPPVQSPKPRMEPVAPRDARQSVPPPEEPLRVVGSLTRRSQPPPPVVPAPLPAPRPPSPSAIPSIEPDAIEPEYIESELLEPPSRPSAPTASPLDRLSQDEVEPKSPRQHSTRPSARQDSAVEFELPIPDLPPQRSAVGPGRPAVGSPRPIPAPRAAPLPESSVVWPDAGHAADPGRTVPLPRSPQRPDSPNARDANWAAGAAFNATLPLGAAGLTTAAWQPPGPTATVPERQAPVATPPPQFEVPSLLASLPKTASLRPALLIDVTPLSLCVETVGGYVDTLIARNTPVPCERTRDFVTAHDNQQSVVVRVAQGESKQFQENVLLGEVQLTGIPAAPRGQSRIAVTFGIDSDGILHVRALDILSGQAALVDLRLLGAPTSPEVAQMMVRHAAKGHA